MRLLLVLCLVGVSTQETLTGIGQTFKRCSLTDSDRCFEVVLDEFTVKIGKKGTNNDVIMKFCADKDATDCCTTPALKSAFSDDWSTGDSETWGDRYFGKCKGKTFNIKKGLKVTISKTGSDGLDIESIDIYTKSPDKKIKETERFQCSGFSLGDGKPTEKLLDCKTGPYIYTEIDNMVCNIGADGTDDSVKAKICSDTNDVCCQVKLSHLFADDWKKNNKETWTKSDFGDCGKILYKVTNQPRIAISKDGKDDLTVKDCTLTMKTPGKDSPVQSTYQCNQEFTLRGDCKTESLCTHTYTSCRTTTSGTGKPTGRPSINTTKPSITNAKSTTTRPPFRSG